MSEAERLEGEIAEVLEKIDDANRAEDDEHGEDGDSGGGLPAELSDRRKRRQRIRELRAQIEPEKGDKLEARPHIPRGMCVTSMTRRAALLDGLALDFATSLTNSPGRVSLESVS